MSRTRILLAGAALAGWWLSLPLPERMLRLGRIGVREEVVDAPPAPMLDQASWLAGHRWGRLRPTWPLLVVAAVIGIGEGIARRRRDVLGGFLLTLWTTGVLGLGLVPCLVAAYLVLPWPLPTGAILTGLGGMVGITAYALCSGKPYIP